MMRLPTRSFPTLQPAISKPHSSITNIRTRSISSSTKTNTDNTNTPATESPSPRWLADVKQRLGKCITFGLNTEQTRRAGVILETLARDWRELVAGSEGYLTSPDRRGLYRQEVVWGEMDSMVRHVNNVIYNRYAESARVIWALRYARDIDPTHAKEWSQMMTPKGLGMILRSIRTDYKFPMTWPDHVTVYHKLSTEPTEETDSFILDVVILSELHQRPAARCVEDIVVYDYKEKKKAPLKGFMVDVLKETWRLQGQEKERNSRRVRELLEEVRGIERGSWDREGAVEDLGVAGEK